VGAGEGRFLEGDRRVPIGPLTNLAPQCVARLFMLLDALIQTQRKCLPKPSLPRAISSFHSHPRPLRPWPSRPLSLPSAPNPVHSAPGPHALCLRARRTLSGTSVGSPVVAGAVCLLASTLPEEKRWKVLNPASMKQVRHAHDLL